MSRLIVVSNRVSAPTDPAAGSAGGLAMALSAALRKYDGLWFGWSGETVEHWTGEMKIEDRAGVTVGLVDLEAQDVDEYYNGYANKTLWPLFHHRIDLAQYERSYGEGYERVNRRFAEVLAPLIQPDDIIWVHDYHMIPMARDLRRLGIRNRIGFFLHTPWPARQLLVTLPHHRRLVESMFDFDLIGFHTREWSDLFTDYVVSEAQGELFGHGGLGVFRAARPDRRLPHRHRRGRLPGGAQFDPGDAHLRPYGGVGCIPIHDRGGGPAGLFQGAGRAAAGL